MTSDDSPAVAKVVIASELFPAEAAPFVDQLMADYFDVKRAEGHRCVVDDEDGELLGVAYYQPVAATERTWELLMIGVRLDRHRQGRGGALLRHVEDDLRATGQRLLLIQTSAQPAFDRARSFYLANHYDEEARVRDYYEPGDDMVMFRKALAQPPLSTRRGPQ